MANSTRLHYPTSKCIENDVFAVVRIGLGLELEANRLVNVVREGWVLGKKGTQMSTALSVSTITSTPPCTQVLYATQRSSQADKTDHLMRHLDSTSLG